MKVTEIVIACFNLKGMLAFYQNVFGLSFKDIKILQGVIYEAHFEGLKITLCTATIAGIKAKDNRQQITFQVDDVKSYIENVEKFGGTIISELQEPENYLQVAVRDVDGNSIVLKQNV
jgi:predicted enzyme related to lactoylglutathione lyase